MTATVMDGKAALAEILVDLTGRVEKLAAAGVTPGLGTLLVGDDPGSQAYVRGKHPDCAKVGINSIRRDLPADISQADLDERSTSSTPTRSAPATSSSCRCRAAQRERRAGAGRPGQGRRRAAPDEPRQAGAQRAGAAAVHAARHRALLRRYEVEIAGARVAVVGRGVTVGRPLGLLLTRRSENSTVTLCHTATRDLAAEVRRADIVVAAAGVPRMVTAEMVAPGAAVVDVGVTRRSWSWSATSRRRCGRWRAMLAPKPGGVGPMTRAMLLTNVVEAAERALG